MWPMDLLYFGHFHGGLQKLLKRTHHVLTHISKIFTLLISEQISFNIRLNAHETTLSPGNKSFDKAFEDDWLKNCSHQAFMQEYAK